MKQTISQMIDAAFRCHQAGRAQLAEATCRQVVALAPQHPEGWHLLGLVSKDLGNRDFAIECIRRTIQLNPINPAAHNNLGILLKNQGRLDEAVACFAQALKLKPDFAQACHNLGNAWRELGRLAECIASCRQSIQIDPGFADVHVTLGNALKDQGKLDEAAGCYRHALALNRNLPAAHNNLGHIYKDFGQLDEALVCYRRAMELRPAVAKYHSNLLYAINFHSGYDVGAIFEEHRSWNKRHAQPLARFIEPFEHDRRPDRRLRVGYVSPDFRSHSVGRFVVPLLQAHDHDRLEIFCYSSVRRSDEYTSSCQAAVDVWRNVYGCSDEEVAQQIRNDKIDILVDLTMHMADNRLLVFARKPAPIQVTYLAYCGTTGLTAIDYRLTDFHLDPPGRNPDCYSEQSIHLPETYWCYRPITPAPLVSALPAFRNGFVTFGSLNNFCKVTQPVLAAWSRLLQSIPDSRLIIHARHGSHREELRQFFEKRGISRQRLMLFDWLDISEYFRLLDEIDIGLDPFPHGGGTTSCDALWMGVPVVSCAGPLAASRGGLSILSNLGLADLVAQDADRYVEIAQKLAANLQRLSDLRSGLRARMQASPLMDEPRFARNIEDAYRDMWRRWCDRQE